MSQDIMSSVGGGNGNELEGSSGVVAMESPDVAEPGAQGGGEPFKESSEVGDASKVDSSPAKNALKIFQRAMDKVLETVGAMEEELAAKDEEIVELKAENRALKRRLLGLDNDEGLESKSSRIDEGEL